MKQQINFRASELTAQQLESLMSIWGTSQTETLTVVIDRIYQQEKRTMTTKTTDYGDVFGKQATVDELIARFNESEFDTLTKYLEAEAVALHGEEAEGNDYATMAVQIEGELFRKLEVEAAQAVGAAQAEPGTWAGRANAEQVVFANDVYTTACNGDGTDYTDAVDAVQALANEWLRDSLKLR